jgi:DNA helicase II / ATP-dependent DNA helicase PcrA
MLAKLSAMDVSPILDPLNEAQRAAVSAPPLPTLVLAGAGSGKTRVLVHRIAWLCLVEGALPHGVLAVTFTNKAAAEMRGRTEMLLGASTRGMWVGTFHGLSHRLLRAHWREAGLPESFQILDSDDQYRLVRRVLRGLELDEARWLPRQTQWFINGRKDEGVRPHQIEDSGDPISRQLVRIYTAYEAACQRAGLIDFAELLLRSLELLRNNASLRAHYRERFRHLLVDEFQDTNAIQYAWLKVLAGEKIPIFAVGDDDQSIYGWRGARIENIQSFSRDFKDAQVFRLEQNYRSTGTILAAANGLIGHNRGRMGKRLWTSGNKGELIALYAAYNEQDEARFVADKLMEWTARGHPRHEVAILYRSNAQSRVFEEVFVSRGIPYRVYGGLRFFERAEVKDAVAYLRLTSNRNDDASFERVVNLPTRGIGERTVAEVRNRGRAQGLTLWQASAAMIDTGVLPSRATNALLGFLRLIDSMSVAITGLPLHEQVDHVIQHSGLLKHYGAEGGEKGQARVENLEELVTAARGFRLDPDQHGEMTPLDAFISHAALEAGEGQGETYQDCAQLMTLHAAKGLEFPLVFLVGMEEGVFPSSMSINEPGRLEEERRLCYVGITRACRQLVISFAESRRQFGSENYNPPSRFIGELPPELVHEVRPRVMVSRPLCARPVMRPKPVAYNDDSGIQVGERVAHAKFGEGVVLDCEGQGRHARVQVNFESAGCKWLVIEYANLQTL